MTEATKRGSFGDRSCADGNSGSSACSVNREAVDPGCSPGSKRRERQSLQADSGLSMTGAGVVQVSWLRDSCSKGKVLDADPLS